MAHVLEYSSKPTRDRMATALGAATFVLMLMDPLAAIVASNLHDGLRSIPVFADLQPRDVLATIIICSIPIAGVLCGICYIWRCRRGLWGNFGCVVLAILFHLSSLYCWERMEVWFWSM